jgi:hypothetical protein
MKRILTIGMLMMIATTAMARGSVPAVIVIRDLDYLKKALGEGAFVPEKKDCYDARADVPRFVWWKMKQAKRSGEAYRWRKVLIKEPVYIWHCGGMIADEKKYVHCTLSRYEKGRGFEQQRFPEVFDGGTDYCEARYDLESRRLVRVSCNGET